MLIYLRSHIDRLVNAAKVLRLAAFFFILCWPLPLLAKDSFPCATQKVMYKHLLTNGYAFAATFISDKHML